MSVAFTEAAVRARTKTVTRRKGWWIDKNGRHLLRPGDHLTLCRKVMGRKPGEPLVRVAEVLVLSVRREPLCAVAGDAADLGAAELAREGFTDIDAWEFMRRYFTPQGIGPMDDVTRIEWRYLEVTQ